LLLASPGFGDTVILRDGAIYSGQFTSAPGSESSFTNTQGVPYKFPWRDVQWLVFSSTTDIVTLRNGKIYSGQYNVPMRFLSGPGSNPVSISLERRRDAGADANQRPFGWFRSVGQNHSVRHEDRDPFRRKHRFKRCRDWATLFGDRYERRSNAQSGSGLGSFFGERGRKTIPRGVFGCRHER
jgi:hypothetical protein